MNHPTKTKVVRAARQLAESVDRLDFSGHIPWVYNPLDYAWQTHQQYLDRFVSSSCEVIFLGMNPGPWGMAQTGVPFGEVGAVRDWLKIDAKVRRPEREHPKRPVDGLACRRSEVSGLRFWGLFRERFNSPETFFEKHFVANYCPLVFMEESARNVTPDKLPVELRRPLQEVCDHHLGQLLGLLQPKWLIGVGAWAEACGRRVLETEGLQAIQVGRILHPSPASPAANKDWSSKVTEQLVSIGVW